jgi:hypothetical protein
MHRIINSIKDWYKFGGYKAYTLKQVIGKDSIPKYHENPFIIKIILYSRDYIKKEYKWVIGIIISISALLIAYLKL